MTKSTGVVRKLDDLGRLTVPMELRRTMNIGDRDALEIFTNGNQIILQKYERGCQVCGLVKDNMVVHDGKAFCHECIVELVRQDRAVSATSKLQAVK